MSPSISDDLNTISNSVCKGESSPPLLVKALLRLVYTSNLDQDSTTETSLS